MRCKIVVICFVLILGLSACQETYIVKVVGEPFTPVFEVDELYSSHYESYRGTISVSEYDSRTKMWKNVWSVAHESTDNIPVTKVKYGETPGGFVVLLEARPLSTGKLYSVFFRMHGGLSATGNFKIVSDGTIFKLVNMGKQEVFRETQHE